MTDETVDLGLTDEDYWENPFKTRVEIETELLDSEQAQFVIGAPKTVPFQQRESLPVLVMRVDEQDVMARLRFRTSAVLVAVELTTNTTYVAKAVEADNVELPPYDGPALEGMGGEAHSIDLRKRLQLPWRRGTYLISAILRDRMSNRVRTVLGKGGYEDPALTEFQAQADSEPAPLTIWPPLPPRRADGFESDERVLPYYRKHEESPPLPEEKGIQLSVPRIVRREAGMRCIVEGSFRLPALARHISRGGANYSALVPITLVLIGADVAGPHVFPLRVPTFDKIDSGEGGAEVTGYFAIDLQELANLGRIDQTFFVYAFSGELALGPIPMAVAAP